MRGVCSFANCTHAVECGNAEGRGEVTIGCATYGCFREWIIEFGGKGKGAAIELNGAAGALHGRTVDAAGDGDRAARI